MRACTSGQCQIPVASGFRRVPNFSLGFTATGYGARAAETKRGNLINGSPCQNQNAPVPKSNAYDTNGENAVSRQFTDGEISAEIVRTATEGGTLSRTVVRKRLDTGGGGRLQRRRHRSASSGSRFAQGGLESGAKRPKAPPVGNEDRTQAR
jgi:hypothetical protein